MSGDPTRIDSGGGGRLPVLPAREVPRIVIIIAAAYVATQMLSDVASLKIGRVAGLAVDMGTFVYPITFTLRDLVHKVLGKRNAQVLIVFAGVTNLFMAGYLAFAAAVPSDAGWGRGAEFGAVLAPMWRIVAASIVAEVASELIDTEIYHWFVTRVTARFQWLRVLTSNSVAVPCDTLIFSTGAFALALPWTTVFEIFLVNLVVKYAVTLASLPLIYIVPDRRRGDPPAEER